jgi:pimeloyl-ACP methyl ester carboxylesterase
MADDTAALLQQLGIENADFFGYSMGAGIHARDSAGPDRAVAGDDSAFPRRAASQSAQSIVT